MVMMFREMMSMVILKKKWNRGRDDDKDNTDNEQMEKSMKS